MVSLLLPFPNFDPIAFRVFGWPVRWYALMYLLGFVVGYVILRRRLRQEPFVSITQPTRWDQDQVENILLAAIFGVVLGGRLGYVFFYNAANYLQHPLDIVKVNEGGMSFHGGALGVFVAMLIMARKYHRPFWQMLDFLVPAVAPGLAFGRWGNFMNGELWGRTTSSEVPWSMIFPGAGPQPRHPSQLYEMILEGVVLAIIVLLYARKARPRGAVSGLFILSYGLFRFVVEFYREPDAQLGLLSLGMSMGQWLCVPMIVGGAALIWWAYRRLITDVETPAISADDAPTN